MLKTGERLLWKWTAAVVMTSPGSSLKEVSCQIVERDGWRKICCNMLKYTLFLRNVSLSGKISDRELDLNMLKENSAKYQLRVDY